MQVEEGARVGGRYVLGGLLGAGGAARVYRAHDERLGVSVAVKILTLVSADAHARLRQEASIQASLRHPNVVAVTDTIDIDGWPGLVMELVEGPSLDLMLRDGALPRDDALDLFAGVLEGVAAAHARGLIHRDLKPGNIMVARAGRRLLPKVTDFGLAKALEGPGGGTRTGALMGTPRYMSPEQVHDSKNVDERTDVFALGAILYELLVGRAAFDDEDTLMVFNKVSRGEHGPIPDDLDPALAQLLRDALAADPEARIGSAQAFVDRLPMRGDVSYQPEVLSRWSQPELAAPTTGEATWSTSLVSVEPDASMASMASVGPTDPTVAPAAVARAEPAPGHPSSWRSWGGALALIGLLGVGAWVATPEQAPAEAPVGFTAAMPPPIDDDAEVVRLLALAWHAVEAGTEDGLPLVDKALDLGATDPAVALLGAMLARARDAERFPEFLARGVDAARGGHGPVPELLVALHDGAQGAEDPAWVLAVLRDHLERWPDDRLATLMLVEASASLEPDAALDEALIERMVAQAPDSVFGRFQQVRAYRSHNRFAEAAVAGEQAVARGVRSPALWAELAVNAQQLGRHEEAVEHGTEALRLDPGWWPARLHAAMSAAHLGDTDTFERLAAPMRGDETPPSAQRHFAFFVARGLATLGQLQKSAEWAAVAQASAEGSDAQSVLVDLGSMQVRMRLHRWIASDEELAAVLSGLDRAAADPTVPATLRHDAGLRSVLAHGVLAARAGDLSAARRALGRLEGEHAAELQVALTVAEGRPLASVDGCHAAAEGATLAWDAGQRDVATDLARQALDTCVNIDSQPFALAWAVLGLAGDDEARATYLEIWPAPDPGLVAEVRTTGWRDDPR